MSESLTGAFAFALGFSHSAHVAARVSGEVVVGIYFGESGSNKTEAKVACRHGNFDRLDEILELMRVHASTAGLE